MANIYIDFQCVQQELTRTDEKTVAEGAAGVLYARFDLCPKWDGLQTYARFKHMGAVYDVPIADGCALIPWEVVKYTGFEVSVFGEDAEGGRLTSAKAFVEVVRSIDYDGVQPIPATPSLLQRFEADAAAAKDAAINALEAADNAASSASRAAESAERAASAAEAMEAVVNSFNTEEWVFTLEDGSTVSKTVILL